MGTRRTIDVQALTEREREVAQLMAKGRTNGQIAEDLGVTFNTAKWHVSQVIAKLDVETREEAVRAWHEGQSLRRRLHAVLLGAGSLSAFKIAATAVAGITVLAATVTAVELTRPGGDGEADAILLVAASTATPSPTPQPTSTETPSVPPGCSEDGTTYPPAAEPCPPEYYVGIEDALATGACNLAGRTLPRNLTNVDLRRCDLRGADFSSVAANEARFDGSDLTGADLHGGSFGGASFEGANLSNTNLAPAIFQEANLRNANLTGATIRDTHFGGARWGNTTCPDGTNSDDPENSGTCVGTSGIVPVPYVLGGQTAARDPKTPFAANELRALDLGSCRFDGLDLGGLRLLRLNLPGCSFTGSNLAGIGIRGVTLGGADLRDANIDGTQFRSVDLTESNLKGATGIPIFEYVKWENTVCPDGTNSGALDGDGQTCESNLLAP